MEKKNERTRFELNYIYTRILYTYIASVNQPPSRPQMSASTRLQQRPGLQSRAASAPAGELFTLVGSKTGSKVHGATARSGDEVSL